LSLRVVNNGILPFNVYVGEPSTDPVPVLIKLLPGQQKDFTSVQAGSWLIQ
jgi:hypothetical protein